MSTQSETYQQCDDAIFWSFLVLLAVAPFPFGGVHLLTQAFFAVIIFSLMLLWCGLQLTADGRVAVSAVRLWPEILCCLSLLSWMGLQFLPIPSFLDVHPLWADTQKILGGHPESGTFTLARGEVVNSMLRTGMYIGVFWLALQFGREKSRANLLYKTLINSGLVYAVYGLVIHLSGFQEVLWVDRSSTATSLSATFINRNNYATLVSLQLLCAVGLYQTTLLRSFDNPRFGRDKLVHIMQKSFTEGALQLTFIVILASALLLTLSRAGITCGLIGLAYLVYSLNLARSRKGWLAKLLSLALPAALVGIVLFSGEAWQQRVLGTEIENESRFVMYQQAWQVVQESPLTGYGAGSFPRIFPMFADETTAAWDKVHNDWLETIFDLGWPVGMIWITALVSLAIRCLAGLLQRMRDRVYSTVGFCACIVVGLHSFFDFSLQIPAVAITFSALLGVGVSQSWHSKPSTSARKNGLVIQGT